MKDFLCNELQVGDDVVFAHPGYRSFTRGVIIKLTKCFVFIDYYYRGKLEDSVRQPYDQVIKVIR